MLLCSLNVFAYMCVLTYIYIICCVSVQKKPLSAVIKEVCEW